MISALGSTILATSPWFLATIPAALALLIYVFRVRGESRRTVVSSLFLLRELPQRPLGRRVFIPPLQFWIELALFSTLALAASALFLTKRGEHVAILIDSSLSMGATTTGSSRLDLMKDRARADISSAPSSSSFSVFSGATRLTKRVGEPVEKTRALQEVADVTLSFARDSLQDHVNQLLLDPTFDTVWVYTDRPVENTSPSPRLTLTTAHRPSQPTHNVWIQEIGRAPETKSPSLSVLLKSTFKDPISVTLKTTCTGPRGESVQPPASVKVKPGETTKTLLPEPTQPWSYCHVRLISSDTFHTETLLADNDAWVTQEGSVSQVAVRSPLSPEQLGLQKIPFIHVEQSNTKASSAASPEIIHRDSLKEPPAAAALLVAPPAGPLPWGGSVAQPQAASITRWDDSHPIMRYVKPSLLSLPRASSLECPASATPLIFSDRGALLCAGEFRGARYVISGVELFPFDGASSPTLSILLLNTLTWLFSQSGTATAPPLPATLTVPLDTTAVEYITPSSRAVPISPLKTISAHHPGILKVTNGQGASRYLSLNAFHETESDLSQSAPLEIRAVPAPAGTLNTTQAQALAPWFLMIALAIAAIDLARRWRRGQSWGVS